MLLIAAPKFFSTAILLTVTHGMKSGWLRLMYFYWVIFPLQASIIMESENLALVWKLNFPSWTFFFFNQSKQLCRELFYCCFSLWIWALLARCNFGYWSLYTRSLVLFYLWKRHEEDDPYVQNVWKMRRYFWFFVTSTAGLWLDHFVVVGWFVGWFNHNTLCF